MSLQAVLSDSGGIIHNDCPARMREFYFLQQHVDVTYHGFKTAFRSLAVRAQTDPNYSREDAFGDYLHHLGRSDLFPDYLKFCAEHFRTFYEDPKPLIFPDVPEALHNLKVAGIPVGVLTDAEWTASEFKDRLYSKAGIASDIDFVLSSKELGFRKPDPRFFQLALDQLAQRDYRSHVEDVLFVGHDIDELEGAYNFGLSVAALRYDPADRTEQRLDFVTKRGCFLSSFADLLPVVGSTEKRL